MCIIEFVLHNLSGKFVPILREGELDIISHSAEQTTRLGLRLGRLLKSGDVLCLSGDMGAGKTVFSAGIGRGWGTKSRLTSPTYNLVHQHRREADTLILYHLDCYRIKDSSEIDTIGFDDMLDSKGILVIEWAERIDDALPQDCLWIELKVTDERRRNFIIQATGKRHQALLDEFRNVTFGV
jgi:tRNA threonylcarbamoyladenosine biosynthesis protein TsaE